MTYPQQRLVSSTRLPVMQEVTIDAAGKKPINIKEAVNNVPTQR